MVWILAIIAVLVIIGVLLVFGLGPYFLQWFLDKVDEWEDVLGSLEKEK